MAATAASLGTRRIEDCEESGMSSETKDEIIADTESKQEAWHKVDKMEQEWTQCLTTASIPFQTKEILSAILRLCSFGIGRPRLILKGIRIM